MCEFSNGDAILASAKDAYQTGKATDRSGVRLSDRFSLVYMMYCRCDRKAASAEVGGRVAQLLCVCVIGYNNGPRGCWLWEENMN